MLTGHETVKKFPIFMETKAPTRARHMSLSWARSSQLITPSNFLKIQFNPIFPSSSGSAKWLLFLKFPHQNPLWTCLLFHTCQMPCPSHSSLITWIILGGKYRFYSSSLYSLPDFHVTSSVLAPNNFLTTQFSYRLSLCSFLSVRDKALQSSKQQAKL